MEKCPQNAHLLDNEPLALFLCSDTPSFVHYRFPHGRCLIYHPGLRMNIAGMEVTEMGHWPGPGRVCGTGIQRAVSSPFTHILWSLEDKVSQKEQ